MGRGGPPFCLLGIQRSSDSGAGEFLRRAIDGKGAFVFGVGGVCRGGVGGGGCGDVEGGGDFGRVGVGLESLQVVGEPGEVVYVTVAVSAGICRVEARIPCV